VYPVSIKGVLFSPKREVVLLLNEREEWELPGGRIELGESGPECLAREIFEELSIQIHVGLPVDTYLFEVVPGKHVFIATYRCSLAGPFSPSVSHEHKCVGLFSFDALPPNLPVGYRRSIDAVRNGVTSTIKVHS
jgi:8-oxo-dGTP pyrophosphatase MutT (NUDIX family)